MTAVSLIAERNETISDRYDVAEAVYAFEWLEAVLDEKRFLVALLRELVREQRPAVATSDAEIVGRLHAALDLIHSNTVDVGSLEAIVAGAIRALGGRT